jgi:hypothetical protein
LEDRAVPTIFTVTTTDDSGAGSLRQAITDANATVGADTIDFASMDPSLQSPGGWWTIQLQAALPSITDTVAIDGASAPGYKGTPLIEIRGLGDPITGGGIDGLTFAAGSSGSVVRGLVLDHFGDIATELAWGLAAAGTSAIHITGPGVTKVVVAGNYIGTDPTGTQPDWNETGVLIDGGAYGNTVGGTATTDRNLISGNLRSAVVLTGIGTQANLVEGNYIGTDVSGMVAIPNAAQNGAGVVRIEGKASYNLVGGSAPGAGNLISGNYATQFSDFDLDHAGDGVGMSGFGTDHNRVQGNWIGTDRTGNADLRNRNFGVRILSSARYNVIGTDGDGVGDATEGNVIVGGSGVGIAGIFTDDNVVAGNFVGLGADGETVIGCVEGVAVWGLATGNLIGGTTEAARNVISGSRLEGVSLGNFDGTAGNTVAGNYIGTDKTGLLARGNAVTRIPGDVLRGGVVCFGTGNNTIGGTSPAARNVISGNGFGVVLETVAGGQPTSGVRIEGNYIGTDKNGAPVLGNGVGIYLLDQSTNTAIGGTEPGAGNLIAGNTGPGILIQGGASVGNAVLGNSIFANGGLGIDLDTGPNGLQNYPVIRSASRTAGGTMVAGRFNSTPNTSFRLEFFASPALDAAGNVEGKVYLGFVNVTTGPDGNTPFGDVIGAAPAGQQYLSGTATRLDSVGNPLDTSEFTPLAESQVIPANTPPVASAGGPYTVVRGSSVRLDASGTTDAEQPNSELLYQWDLNGDGVFDDATGMNPTFSAVGLNDVETRTIGLAVTDGGGLSSTTTATLQVVAAAVLPDPDLPGQQSLFVGGTTGNDTIAVTLTASGTVKVVINGVSAGTFSPTGDDSVQVGGAITLPAWLYGDAGNDQLKGGGGPDVLEGGDGNDTLTAQVGNDTLAGGRGNDSLVGGSGNDSISGGDGNDTLLGGTGDDFLDGGAGDDSLDGGGGNDTLLGGAGFADSLLGGAGDDVLADADGVAIAAGGADNDTITLAFAADWNLNGSTTLAGSAVDGGSGDDSLDVTVLNAAAQLDIHGSGGSDRVELHGTWTLIRVYGGTGIDVVIDNGAGTLELHSVEG